jgi:hypothetical protein
MRHYTNDIEKRAESIALKAFLDHYRETKDFEGAIKIRNEVYESSMFELMLTQIEGIIFERRYDEGKKRRTYRSSNI